MKDELPETLIDLPLLPRGESLFSRIARHTKRKWARVTAIAAVLAAAIAVTGHTLGGVAGLWEFYRLISGTHAGTETIAGVDSSSVAVLPFANLSDDKGNEYFSDGISEELMTVLQKISGVHVTARSSSFAFKGTSATAQEIGRKLGVAHLIEGSVRKYGTTVRITARLTSVATGKQLWADSHTRDLKDVFALQAELAQTIVEQLRESLDANLNASSGVDTRAQIQAAVRGGTRDPEAYDVYLLGLHHRLQNTTETTITAQRELERAVEKDPAFAKAWAALAGVGALRAGWAPTTRERQEAEALARTALNRALALEPDAPETQLAQLWNQKWFDLDWRGAAESLRRAQRVAPDFPRTVVSAALLEITKGRPQSALPLAAKAVALDPLGAVPRATLGMALLALKQYEEAEQQFRRQTELSPNFRGGHTNIALTYLLRGRPGDAMREAALEPHEPSRLGMEAMASWALKRYKDSDDALQRLAVADAENGALGIAAVHAFRGERDRAFPWLERAYSQRDAGLAYFKLDPSFEPLHDDPRWAAYLRRIGLSDEQLK
jgi:TolB-like protein/Tfp pilus assembly protein PilF